MGHINLNLVEQPYIWFSTCNMSKHIYHARLSSHQFHNVFTKLHCWDSPFSFIAHTLDFMLQDCTHNSTRESYVLKVMWSKTMLKPHKIWSWGRGHCGQSSKDSFMSVSWDTYHYTFPGAHFTNDFFNVIQIKWKFHSAFIKVVVKWSLWMFAHGTIGVLSWHVPNIVAIWHFTTELH